MKKILPCFVMLGALAVAGGEGFEAPSQPGNVLPSGWQGTGEVSAEESASGTQSLKVGSDGPVRYGTGPESGIVFFDLQILPVAGTSEILNISGARIGFGPDGKVLVLEGSETVGRAVQNATYELEDGVGASWVRLTVRVDADKKTWDLWVDGRPAEANLILSQSEAALVLNGQSGHSVYLDDFIEVEENPLFPDADRDGMADAEEKANGLNPYGDDREGDLDGDGVSNVEEMFAGSSPQAPGSLDAQAGQLIYVDNLNGSDGFSGARSYVVGQDGPKASLKAAMTSASTGATIVVLRGNGLYDEGSRGVPGKQLTIRPVDPVTIR